MFHLLYGSMRGLVPASAESKPEPSARAAGTNLAESPEARRILGSIAEGGYTAAVIRMMILLAGARGTVRRSRLERSNRLLHEDPAFAALSESDIKRIIFEQTLIVELQPDAADAERALSVVETVAGPVEEMEEHTITMFARMREALGCETPVCSASSEAA